MKMKFKKKDIYAISERNIKILRDGSVKVHKGVKYPLEPFIRESTDNSICLPIDNIINQEPIGSTKDSPDIDYKMTTMADVISIPSYVALYHSQNVVRTVVATTTRKVAADKISFDDLGIIGSLMRTSTLPSIYKRVRDSWTDINENAIETANVLFIPGIFVYLDNDTGAVLKYPYKVNLLVISEPNKKDIENSTDYQLANRMISHILEAAVKCNANNMVIAPYCHKWLVTDLHETANAWHININKQDVRNSIESITFAINNEDYFIIFKNTGEYNSSLDASLSL
jgi:hypothetical protein